MAMVRRPRACCASRCSVSHCWVRETSGAKLQAHMQWSACHGGGMHATTPEQCQRLPGPHNPQAPSTCCTCCSAATTPAAGSWCGAARRGAPCRTASRLRRHWVPAAPSRGTAAAGPCGWPPCTRVECLTAHKPSNPANMGIVWENRQGLEQRGACSGRESESFRTGQPGQEGERNRCRRGGR